MDGQDPLRCIPLHRAALHGLGSARSQLKTLLGAAIEFLIDDFSRAVLDVPENGRDLEEMILIVGSQLRGGRHSPEIMTHIVPIAICACESLSFDRAGAADCWMRLPYKLTAYRKRI